MKKPKIAVWFSCGAASAVAAKKTIEIYGAGCEVIVINNPIKEEHPDNQRFLKDCEKWLGVEIQTAKSPIYPDQSTVEVWENKRLMATRKYAPCTDFLKKKAREHWEIENKPDFHVLGFTIEETIRQKRFIEGERPNTISVLINLGLSKADCFKIIQEAGLELPEIYKLGYPNANCIGCVKATSPTYWNHVRKMHPEVFESRASQSREIGARLVRVNNKRIFLDKLDPEAKGYSMKNMDFECGIFCEERPKRKKSAKIA